MPAFPVMRKGEVRSLDGAELTVLEGSVDSVVYQNEENGYTVLRLDVGEDEPITVVVAAVLVIILVRERFK